MRASLHRVVTWIPPELERLARAFEATGDLEAARRLRDADFREYSEDGEHIRRVVRDVRTAIESAAALGGQARANQLLDALLRASDRRDAAARQAAMARAAGVPSWIPLKEGAQSVGER